MLNIWEINQLHKVYIGCSDFVFQFIYFFMQVIMGPENWY
jgi:hypothetical protein